MTLVKPLNRLRKDDIASAGGKGANLGELIRIGMPVPQGFVITTSAYEKILEKNPLRATITSELKKSKGGRAIREMFMQAPVPAEIERAIKKAFLGLGVEKVAVRSSATAEDLPDAAFAGQQDTYLNTSEEELLSAVKKVWASLWSERAIAYRERLAVDQGAVRMAVVVQPMVEAEVSGVLFTANVISGARDEVVVDASSGLGEKLVSGEVTPEHFVFKKKFFGWKTVEHKRGDQSLALDSKKLQELIRLGKKIEKHFGSPQDIEFALKGGKLYILQARPITALARDNPQLGRVSRLFSTVIAEMFPRRPYPLERLLLDLLIRKLIRQVFGFVGFKTASPEESVLEEEDQALSFTGDLRIRPTPLVILAPWRLFHYALRYNPARWREDPLVRDVVQDIKTLESKVTADLPPRDLMAIVHESLDIFPRIIEVRLRYLPRAAMAILGTRFFLALAGEKKASATLLFTGIETKVTETNAKLVELAAMIDTGGEFEERFRNFLDEYGYREGAGSMLIAEPSWKDNPEAVLTLLRTMAHTPSKSDKPDWQEIRDRIISGSVLRYYPWRPLFTKVLDTARHTHEIREDTRFHMMMLIQVIRRAANELGDRFKHLGVTKEPEDIFYFKFEELEEEALDFPPSTEEAHQLKSLLVSRKKKYAELSHIPFVDPRMYERKVEGEGIIVSGTAGSPGIVEGRARIIHDSKEFGKLEAQDILVAPYTNPSWTPLFEKAVGVVVDTGSVVSHAAIVAREYGIPAVMGTASGTKKITDGELIRVDGNAGIVTKKP